MPAATLAAPTWGFSDVRLAFSEARLMLAAIEVGVSSSVGDPLAMARLPHASFALPLARLPASAAATGVIVRRQVPSLKDIAASR